MSVVRREKNKKSEIYERIKNSLIFVLLLSPPPQREAIIVPGAGYDLGCIIWQLLEKATPNQASKPVDFLRDAASLLSLGLSPRARRRTFFRPLKLMVV